MLKNDAAAPDVAGHYDELDPFYRSLWGEHVHHGLWKTGRESPLDAVAGLSRHVAAAAAISPGDRVCDVGCGYGATARLIAEEFQARVTGITISAKQHQLAQSRGGAEFRLGDWLENDFRAGSFDAVIAIESTEHFSDVAHGIREMARVLRPGGRLVICAWLSGASPSPWQRRHLLEPVCREGCLVGMGTEADYVQWLASAELEVIGTDDLSRQVRRTWPICVRRTLAAFFADADLRRFLLDHHQRHRVFAVTLVRIWIAYLTGAMRYVAFTARKPENAPTGNRTQI